MPSPTPSQTLGPFFGVLVPERGALLMAAPEASGPRVVVTGVVRDGRGAPVPDALVEVWQPLETPPDRRVWSDDFSNLLEVIRWK